MYAEWHESYKIGIIRIDQQHRKLFGFLHKIYESMLKKEDHEARETLLDELVAFAKEHFAEEERYMKEYEYPGSTDHIQEHVHIIEEINEFYKSGLVREDMKSLLDFLVGWINNHMAETDSKLGAFLSEKGVR